MRVRIRSGSMAGAWVTLASVRHLALVPIARADLRVCGRSACRTLQTTAWRWCGPTGPTRPTCLWTLRRKISTPTSPERTTTTACRWSATRAPPSSLVDARCEKDSRKIKSCAAVNVAVQACHVSASLRAPSDTHGPCQRRHLPAAPISKRQNATPHQGLSRMWLCAYLSGTSFCRCTCNSMSATASQKAGDAVICTMRACVEPEYLVQAGES